MVMKKNNSHFQDKEQGEQSALEQINEPQRIRETDDPRQHGAILNQEGNQQKVGVTKLEQRQIC